MSPDSSPRQLPLSMPLDTEMTRANWLSRAATTALEQWLFEASAGAYLQGEAGVGKSHLLQALCQSVEDALYLPLRELLDMPPMALLESTEGVTLLAIDEAEAIQGHADWQEALFHLFNRAQQTGVRLVVAGRTAPAGVDGLLPDLKSRLEALPVFALPRFTEQELDELLALRGSHRGLTLSPEVRSYLLRRVERSPVALMALLDRLDHEALARGRAITIPLLRELRFPTPDH